MPVSARGGCECVLRVRLAGDEAQEQQHTDLHAENHMATEPLHLIGTVGRHVRQHKAAGCKRYEGHQRHQPMQRDEKGMTSLHDPDLLLAVCGVVCAGSLMRTSH